ncbi:YraN family protein [Elongatibacter sediminis]|uniref:UPF0102 protein V3330_15340 n=1 Tax=Elongatibacter sediminis TaxID=3119006 RepID=A0AAW9RHV2_9GAMM
MTGAAAAGSDWERRAESFLRNQGLRPLARNFSCRLGELDLILLDGGCVVFTEVRYRRDTRHGTGAETVTPAKQQRLLRTARVWLQRHRRHARLPCRFDVVSMCHRNGSLEVDWIRNAFTA